MKKIQTRLRAEIAKHGPERGKRYPREVRAQVVRYAERRRDSGARWLEIAEELGMYFETVRRWCMPAKSPSIVPVEVASARSDVAIVSPCGFRLEGLNAVEAVAALRALG